MKQIAIGLKLKNFLIKFSEYSSLIIYIEQLRYLFALNSQLLSRQYTTHFCIINFYVITKIM